MRETVKKVIELKLKDFKELTADKIGLFKTELF